MAAAGVVLTPGYVQGMGLGAVFKPEATVAGDTKCSGLAFSDSGSYLASSHGNGVISVYSGETGAKAGEFHSQEFGCRLITYTHHEEAVLHTANRGTGEAAGQICYHSLHENKILRFFKGHTDFVTSISMNPTADTFLSVSRNGTFRIWDLRAPKAVAGGETGVDGLSVAAFDNSGAVFGVATCQRMLALYDARTFKSFASTTKPLLQYTVTPAVVTRADPATGAVVRVSDDPLPPPLMPIAGLINIEFSPDDRYIAVTTVDRGIMVLDAYTPSREMALLASHPIDPSLPCNASFSADGRFIVTGSPDGHVYAYDVSGKPAGVTLGAESAGLTEDLPYEPHRWDPECVIVGEAHKSAAARAAAWTGAASHRAGVQNFLRAQNEGKRAPGVRPPLPATAEEQVSRHETAVKFVKWHPKAAVLATAGQAVGLWVAPSSGSAAATAAADATATVSAAGGSGADTAASGGDIAMAGAAVA